MHVSARTSLIRLAGLFALALVCGGCSLPGSTSIDDATEPVDKPKARQLFQQTCRTCHALADADAVGVFGPDLDLLAPDAQTVRRQIDTGGGGMPSQLLDGADADLVARYVAQVAGRDPASTEAAKRAEDVDASEGAAKSDATP